MTSAASFGKGPAPRLSMEKVAAARQLLRNVLPISRVATASSLGNQVFLKLESEGPTGSFKVRGAYHAIYHHQQKKPLPGVVTSSTGNHGAAVAYAARLFGLPARVYLPQNPNPAKRARIAQHSAEIVEVHEYLELTREHAARFAEESGWFNLVDGAEPEMLPGTATIACEVLEQVPDVDVLFVPVGDSTLIQGVAFAAKQLCPTMRIIGVQAERAPAYALSFRAGHAVATESGDTLADGLAVRQTTEQNVREIAALVDDFVLVSEEEMLRAVRHLLLEEHVLAEPAGAATTAAYLQTSAACDGKKVVLLVTGANISQEILALALQSH